jgi:hypothetical protein
MTHNDTSKFVTAAIVVITILISQGMLVNDTVMERLFNDNTNIMVLIAMVGLALYLDLQVGIVLFFAVLVLSIRYRREGFQSEFVKEELPSIEELDPAVRVALKENFVRDTVPVVKQEIKREGDNEGEGEGDGEVVEDFSNLTADSTPLGNTERQYDFVGCKYNNDGKSVNASMYGPPVSGCDMLRDVDTSKTGTVFYPLNA